MNSIEIILFAAIGAGLAGLYLGALWLTVASLASARSPLMLLFVSTFLRLVLLIVAIVLLTGMEGNLLAACLTGFFAVRLLTTTCLRPAASAPVAASTRGGPS